MLSRSVVFHQRGGKCGRAEATASAQTTERAGLQAAGRRVQNPSERVTPSAWEQTVTLHIAVGKPKIGGKKGGENGTEEADLRNGQPKIIEKSEKGVRSLRPEYLSKYSKLALYR